MSTDDGAAREAEAWFRRHPDPELWIGDFGDGHRHAATIVRAWLARDVPAPDDDDMYGTTCTECLDPLDDDHPYGTNADGDHVHYACADDVPTDPSPRTWSLPAPPPDDVTVVHIPAANADLTASRFHRDDDGSWWNDAGSQAWGWSQMLGTGTVVEGEPPAPEPQAAESASVILFKPSGKYYTTEEWVIPSDAIGPYDMDRCPDFRRINGGAVLIPSQEPWGFPHLFPTESEPPVPESQAAEPPRFERGFYRLARDVEYDDGLRSIPTKGVTVALVDVEGPTEGHDGGWVAMLPHGANVVLTDADLAAAGAERVEDR